ncbi:MarR family winged helix-turn-helix transcriptional regulator [Schaalia suimastitidis]|uniref:MarR family winged helix-turn-helix transcriptional regulator n=1 Tax=Schaalia suimastitidis TaxID=121163 RepID=UPI00040A7E2C|nr:MarR family winged helix-turn-helix transcriptional regulator [Schaalia suimastitidis]
MTNFSEEYLPDAATNEQAVAWRAFFRTMTAIQTAFADRLKQQLSLTLADYHVLMALWDAPNHTLRMGQIATAISYSPSRVSYLVSQLADRKLIEHELSPHDARGFTARLSRAGLAKAIEAMEIHQKLVREMVLSGANEQIISCLASFFANLEYPSANDAGTRV